MSDASTAAKIFEHLQQNGFAKRDVRETFEIAQKLADTPHFMDQFGKSGEISKKAFDVLLNLNSGPPLMTRVNNFAANAEIPFVHNWILTGSETKGKLYTERRKCFAEGNQFVKQAEGYYGELAALGVLSQHEDPKALAESLQRINQQALEAGEAAGIKIAGKKVKTASTDFEAVGNRLRLGRIADALNSKLDTLDQPELRNYLKEALNSGTVAESAPAAEIPAKAFAEEAVTVRKALDKLTGNAAKRLESLASRANQFYDALAAKGKHVPGGRVSSGLFVSKAMQYGNALGELLEVNINTVGSQFATARKAMAEAAEQAKAAGAAAPEIEETLETARTWGARLFAKEAAKDGTPITNLKQARALEGGISLGKTALVAGGTALGASWLLGLGPFASKSRREELRRNTPPEPERQPAM